MIIVALFFIVGILLSLYHRESGFLFGGLVLGLVALALSSLIDNGFIEREWVANGSQNLVALKDRSAASGSFFLGSGTIDSKLAYSYYVKDNDSAVPIITIQDSSAVHGKMMWVKEQKSGDAKVNYFVLRPKNPYYWLWAINFVSYEGYEFQVPEGTIAKSFELNK